MKNRLPPATRLVYSTDTGRVCPGCDRPETNCVCAERDQEKIRGNGQVRVRRESKGRGGKTVTTISGLALNEAELKELCTTLKKACGTGGSVKEDGIEIQGDHVDFLVGELVKRGHSAKRGGG